MPSYAYGSQPSAPPAGSTGNGTWVQDQSGGGGSYFSGPSRWVWVPSNDGSTQTNSGVPGVGTTNSEQDPNGIQRNQTSISQLQNPMATLPPAPTVNKADFQLPDAGSLTSALQQQYQQAQNRQAPTIGPAAQVAAVNLTPAQQALAVKLGPAAQAQSAGFGGAGAATAGQAAGVNIGTAAQAQDSAFRANQAALIDQLNKYATGQQSVAAEQLRQGNEQALRAQLAMAASARPGNQALAARTAAQNMGTLQAGLAGQQALAGIQEREAMAAQLNALLGTARGQDLGLSQFNAGQTNQQAQAQGRLTADINLGNAGFQTQAGIANAADQTQMGIAQGQAATQQAIANAQLASAQQLEAARLEAAQNQFNAQQTNQQSALAAQLAAARESQNATLAQQQGQFGVSAQLQAQQQQAAAEQAALAAQLQAAGMQQQGNIAYAGLSQQSAYQQQQLAQQLALAKLAAQTQLQTANIQNPGPGVFDYIKAFAPVIAAGVV